MREKLALALFLLLPSCFASCFLVSNATIGGKIYVLSLANESCWGNETLLVTSPSGEKSQLALTNFQAKINASRLGVWKIEYCNETALAIVGDEKIPWQEVAEEAGGRLPFPVLPLMLLIFALPLAVLAYVFYGLMKRGSLDFRKFRKGGKAVLEVKNSLGELRDVRIEDWDGGRKIEWKVKALPLGKRLVFSREGKPGEGKPARLTARMGDEKIEIFSGSEKGRMPEKELPKGRAPSRTEARRALRRAG